MKKPMFITDLDGTLLRSDRTFAAVDLDALARLGDLGVLRVIATGRSSYSFMRLMTGLLESGNLETDLPVDYIIFSTGAGIMTWPQGTLLKHWRLETEEVAVISSCFEDLGMDYMIHRPVPDTRYFVYRSHGDRNPDFVRRIEMYNDYAAPLNINGKKAFGPATEVLSILLPEHLDGLENKVRERLKGFNVIRATSPLDGRSVWLEVFPKSVSKSQSASWLADHVGVGKHVTAAVGNDYNDSDLLEWAGTGIVVANAPDVLKNKTITVASNDSGGVAEAADLFLDLLNVKACIG